MADKKTERKVTVILATDVVGYSTKMEENEEQTLANLKACRSIIDGLIKEHHGRIFNTAGDSVLAEFQSAVEAVICASEFQNTILRSATIPSVKRSRCSSDWALTWGTWLSKATTSTAMESM